MPTAFAPLTNVIRALAMDAVQQANSGHPGMPMGMADIAEVLWRRHLRHNPANPHWPDRDRFVLSNGHGSMLLYTLLHLTGYDVSIADLKNFRQFRSKTPGHPEVGHTPGVETTTGPLGQGLANAVGMAIAEQVLAAEFNRPDHTLVDHSTYVFLGDGCLMEGISHEACSLAGTLGLGKLIAFYDDNGISIDGHVEGWFTDDTPKRFEAYGWQVIATVDGHDRDAIDNALLVARTEKGRPTLICCQTRIGFGSPNKVGSHDVHGAPLGAAEVAAARAHIGWPHAPFEIPDTVYAEWDGRMRGHHFESNWKRRLAAYELAFPDLAAEFSRRMNGELPADWTAYVAKTLAEIAATGENIATRKASQNAIAAFAPRLPELIGGSADLAGSNLTLWAGSKAVSRGEGGNYLYYGVREFAMTAVANGLALHGGLIPYTATFLVFSDYARNAIRMAALMKLRQIMVYTHDSIGLGEDGPTHQPIEHVASLRLIPNVDVWRPADASETTVAWVAAIERRDGPTILALSRQNLPTVTASVAPASIRRGGYVLADCAAPQVVLIATGSEVKLALDACQVLADEGIAVRVVSLPCAEVFDRQDAAWRAAVLPRAVPRVAIEAGVSSFWRQYVGLDGAVMGIDRFGESAPAGQLFDFFGFTVANVVTTVKTLL
ncbi:transketolase 1, thiamin-binding [Candidatus Accumulibacter aalborgensis]|uniref:Transketolase n=1 Tax=Candidatus Accumulibacter aalborgensis TaxID=1860102 RepID=A0A1A8XKP0_9PROT|nr:transketolase [Candidatus Accumulibacter aalborgensis]SBT05715.1 transketolase 1, thiamin-binding [Candidatus Accumulibacter aalborgensis]